MDGTDQAQTRSLPRSPRRCRAAGCVAAEEEAEELVRAAPDGEGLQRMVDRRLTGEPLAWITGETVFCGLTVAIEPGVFVPRWQSEPLALMAAQLLPPDGDRRRPVHRLRGRCHGHAVGPSRRLRHGHRGRCHGRTVCPRQRGGGGRGGPGRAPAGGDGRTGRRDDRRSPLRPDGGTPVPAPGRAGVRAPGGPGRRPGRDGRRVEGHPREPSVGQARRMAAARDRRRSGRRGRETFTASGYRDVDVLEDGDGDVRGIYGRRMA